jgi:alpha-L-rhamnosidase
MHKPSGAGSQPAAASQAACISALLCLLCLTLQAANPKLQTQAWSAHWISVPSESPYDYGVYHFRRTFDLPAQPSSFLIHVTADNRYKLYVNGEFVSLGPARGDLHNWRYESVDIASHLKTGKNVLSALVWNFGELAPEAQTTNRTGLLIQGDSEAERIVDTGKQWKGIRDAAYSPVPRDREMLRFYYVTGPGDQLDAKSLSMGLGTARLRRFRLAGRRGGQPRRTARCTGWSQSLDAGAAFHPADGINAATDSQKLRSGGPSHEIPPHTKATLLFDQTFLTTGYPQLTVSGGKDARIDVGYAESLWLPGLHDKGNRNEIEGKQFIGGHDTFIADGATAAAL